MPTKKQLHDNWIAEKAMGLNASDFYGDEHLSPQEANERNFKAQQAIQRQRDNTEGEVLGYYSWDFENDCLKFTVNPDL